jgi:hypothetical protein
MRSTCTCLAALQTRSRSADSAPAPHAANRKSKIESRSSIDIARPASGIMPAITRAASRVANPVSRAEERMLGTQPGRARAGSQHRVPQPDDGGQCARDDRSRKPNAQREPEKRTQRACPGIEPAQTAHQRKRHLGRPAPEQVVDGERAGTGDEKPGQQCGSRLAHI